MTKKYLGDSVYCELIGEEIILTTENRFGATNTIVLDPDTLDALLIVISSIRPGIK